MMLPLLLLLPIHLLLLSPHASSTRLHEQDAAALRDILDRLRDLPGSKFFCSWSSSDACAYAGVACAPDYDDPDVLRVSSLTLGTGLADSPGLAGTLPPSLADLTALTDLVLYPGRVAGTIPLDIGSRLRRLRLLSLTGNLLSGSIPGSLAGLPDLHTLDLSNNHLQGPIPCGLLGPSSPSLRVLVLANNGGLSADISVEFASSRLFHVDLSRNSMAGTVPPLPPTLRYLSVAENTMQGSLDAAFGGHTCPSDLVFLDLSVNYFSGSIPPAVFALPSLSTLILSRNKITGPITIPPFWSDTAPQWSVVDVSHNGISGEVPQELASAKTLYINNNRLSGEVPEAIARSLLDGRMTTFHAQHNFLNGFPAPPSPMPESVALCLSYNCMDLPAGAPVVGAGCPIIGGPLQARPTEQCRGNDASHGDRNGGAG